MLCFLHFLIVLDSCHFKFVNLKFDPQCKGNSWLKWSFLIYLCYILLPSFAGIFFRKTHARVSRVGWFSCFTPVVDAQHEAPLQGGPVSSGGHFQASLENALHCPQKPVLATVASNFIVVPFSFNCQEKLRGPLYPYMRSLVKSYVRIRLDSRFGRRIFGVGKKAGNPDVLNRGITYSYK